MQVFDEVKKEYVSILLCTKVVINHTKTLLEFGYTSEVGEIVTCEFLTPKGERIYACLYDNLKDILIYDNNEGIYISKINLKEKDIPKYTLLKGNGDYPYHFARRYEAVEHFELFEGRQKVLKEIDLDIEKHIKYSFGLEFETSMGYIPENLCFRDGLIPLRDGSISGLEYSTVVLKGNEGISLLHQQLSTLRKFTAFNKECSLHIHFGGFPLKEDTIFRLFTICRALEPTIRRITPKYTFCSAKYKKNGKDYCKLLPPFTDFNDLYRSLVGRNFFGSFTMPHPNDVDREAKWRIPTRYFWVNFINALCYSVNKTIEFRFLRPSYNFEKILIWIYILNAILRIAEEDIPFDTARKMSLGHIIDSIYPKDLSKYIKEGIVKLEVLAINQYKNDDPIGRDVEFERALFKESF